MIHSIRRWYHVVILTKGHHVNTSSKLIQNVLISCFFVKVFFMLLLFHFLDTCCMLSPSRLLSFSIRFIFSIAFICLFPSRTRTIHHPVDRSIDFSRFHQHTPKKRERSLNMSVWGIVMELITFHLTMNIDQGRADERPNKCRYTHTYPFSQAVPSPGPFFPALLVFNLSLVLSCTFIKSLTFLNMKLQGCN